MTLSDDTRREIEQYLKRRGDVTVPGVIAAVDGLTPADAEAVAGVLDEDWTHEDSTAETANQQRVAESPDALVSGAGTTSEYVDDPGFAGDTDAVREHYSRATPVFEALATLDDEYPTLAFAGNAGWYDHRPVTKVEPLEAGWDARSRAQTLDRDWRPILDDIGADGKARTLYNIASWKAPDSVYKRRLHRYDPDPDEQKWQGGEKPLPAYRDLRGFGFWVDLDLADELKPQRGDLDPETVATVEAAQAELIDEVASLHGVDDDAIYSLDSGGGSYVYGPPEATLPIAEYYEADDDAREAVLDEVRDRLTTWAKDMWTRVCDRVDNASDVLDPDFMQNKNRQSKAPLAIHQDHDIVVTPLRARNPETGAVTGEVDYSPTLVSDVDEDLVAETTAWARGLTEPEYTDAVGPLVATLWSEYTDEHDGWRAVLDAWLEDERSTDEPVTTDLDDERHDDVDLAGLEITTSIDDVYDDIESLDIERIAERTIVHQWTDQATGLTDRSGDGNRAFVPIWGKNANSGNANYVDTNQGVWVDTGSSGYGTAVEMALIAEENWSRGDIASGEDWARGVEYLRRYGFDIQVHIPDAREADDDQMPYWAVRRAALAFDILDEDEFIEREGDDGGTYLGFPDSETYTATLEELAARGVQHGRQHGDRWSDETPPTELDVVLDPEKAWRAAGAVTPDDLDEDLGTVDGDTWTCPHCDAGVDVVRAVALEEGLVTNCEEDLGDQYDTAYRRARDRYGAPLPEYVTAATATDNWELIQGAVEQLEARHILGNTRSAVTVDDPGGDAIAKLDPTWEDSESGERIAAWESGHFWCFKHKIDFDPLRLVALEHDLIAVEDAALEGENFKEAYHLAREEYGAPLPEWNVGNPDHIPVLPPSEDLLGEFTTDSSRLDEARKEVEELYRDVADNPATAHLLTVLPALGKTTSVVKNAHEYPALYLARRKELMGEVAEKAAGRGLSYMHLPVFSEIALDDVAAREAVDAVREQGTDLLARRDDLLATLTEGLDLNEDDAGDDDLDRASCPTANGAHGENWALAVHTARSLGHSPRDIHTHDEALFGDALPCRADGDCPYSMAWDRATDPEAPKDILIGHYGHGHVAGARTHYAKDDGRTDLTPRVAAVDEFPGDAYAERFGEIYKDHAAWLAKALSEDVDDVQDLFEQDLWGDEFLRAWLHGNAREEIEAVDAAAERLKRMGNLLEIVDEAEVVRDVQDQQATEAGLAGALEAVSGLPGNWTTESIEDAYDALRAAVDHVPGEYGALAQRVEDDILAPLATVCVGLGEETDLEAVEAPDSLTGELERMFDGAVDAFADGHDGARGLLEATQTALEGGEAGCRELALFATDGFAHPLSYLLLYGVIAPDDVATELTTNSFEFDLDSEGTNLKQVNRGKNTVLVDRNHHGALVHHPPEFRDNTGRKNPVVGLDATGRERLWTLALGQQIQTEDIHETPRERRAFLRDVLNLQIVQTTPHVKTYSGSTDSKNFDGDVELVREIADRYGSAQLRRDTLTASTKPGVITTKKVRTEIEDRIEDDVGAIDHYGNVTGSNALAEHNIAAVLGCRHFGDHAAEKWAALAGEEVTRVGHGADLDYQSPTANTFLQHMREDQTMQAILRFGRDEEGAIVFAHTAALRDDLPVVGDGAVVRAFSENTQAVARAAKAHRDHTFTVGDLVDEVDCSRRTVRRALNEFAELGYLKKRETQTGVANQFGELQEPGVGEADLPDLETPVEPGDDPDNTPLEQSNTGFVWVVGRTNRSEPQPGRVRSHLPAPNGGDRADQASAPPG